MEAKNDKQWKAIWDAQFILIKSGLSFDVGSMIGEVRSRDWDLGKSFSVNDADKLKKFIKNLPNFMEILKNYKT